MKILLLGHNGYLGSYLYKNLQCDIATGRYGTGAPSSQYDIVLNCIAKTDMDWCEANATESLAVNTTLVAELTQMYPEAKLVHFSTYYVYNVSPTGLATEESPVARNSLKYIQHKILGELWNSNGINFRVGKLFGNPLKEQTKLTKYILENDPLELDAHSFNPCSCQCILNVIKNQDFMMNAKGVFNLANLGVTNPQKYASFILNYLEVKKTMWDVERHLKNFHNYGRFAMSLDKIQQHLELDHWEKDMIDFLENYA